MTRVLSVWPGTDAERDALVAALQHNCSCTVIVGTIGNGTAPKTCEAHRMLADERVLKHLLFVRRSLGLFESAEWAPGES